MFEVDLNGKAVAFVDDEDAELVSSLKWYPHSGGYASGPGGTILLHRFVMGCTPGDGVLIDHENGNKLDCRKANLRRSNYSKNAANRHKPDSRSRSGVPGVGRRGDRFCVYIFSNGKRHYLGTRPTLIEAAQLRASGEMRYVGEVSPVTRNVISELEG